jgi:glycosyltransferase involved in cell wall biosynthesis
LRTNGFNIFPVALLCLVLGKPYGLYVVGDVREIARNKAGPGLRGLVITSLGAAHSWLMGVIARFARFTILIGSYDHLVKHVDKGRVFHCLTSVISDGEIRERRAHSSSGHASILYVGRVSREKGLRHLIEAVKSLVDDGYEVILQVVGDGPALPGLREHAERCGLAGRCSFLGRVPYGPELAALYEQADLFVLPSTTEGIPKVLLEAMAHGAAVIATRVGGVPTIVQHMYNGILVRPRRSDEIAEWVKRLVDDPATRERLVKEAYAFVREHTREKQAEKVASIIRTGVAG